MPGSTDQGSGSDTIVAIASPSGIGLRGILRVSGPVVGDAVSGLVVGGADRLGSCLRGAGVCTLWLPAETMASGHPGVPEAECEALFLSFPGPASYTGDNVIELHLLGSPLLLARVERALLGVAAARGLALRPATPGEFTRRAFEAGKLDLAESEGVMALIHAVDETQRREAFTMLSGGLSESIDVVRDGLLGVAALLESGLDFGEDDTGAVPEQEWRPDMLEFASRAEALADAVPASAGASGELAMLGFTNAGKSSLANALAGRDAVMVGSEEGLTRDAVRVAISGSSVVLLDLPGELTAPAAGDAADGLSEVASSADAGDSLDRDALVYRDRIARRADAAVLVLDARQRSGGLPAALRALVDRLGLPVRAIVWTHADLVEAEPRIEPLAGSPTETSANPSADPEGQMPSTSHEFLVSSRTGAGLPELLAHLKQQQSQQSSAPASEGSTDSWGRLRGHLQTCVAALHRALHEEGGNELVAFEIREAVSALGEIHGGASSEDVLDRVFGAFCLGK